MSKATNSGQLETLKVAIPYQPDTLGVFRQLCEPNGHHLLLDSADIGTKSALKSLLLVDAAIKVTCRGQQVTIQALTDNGAQLLPFLAQQLPVGTTYQRSTMTLTAQFNAPATNQPEEQRLKADSNVEPLRVLQQQLVKSNHEAQSNPLAVFLGGVFGYDYVATYEQLPKIPAGTNDCPDYVFYLAETLLVVDHEQQQCELLGSFFSGDNEQQRYQQLTQRIGEIAARCQLSTREVSPATNSAPTEQQLASIFQRATPDAATFKRWVEQLKEHILDGDIFQVVPSRQFVIDCPEPLTAYQQLKRNNPSPYMFFLSHPDFSMFGASPESALKYQQATNQVELYPIAGTRPRGRNSDGTINADLDSRLELELRLDQKELSEHLMLVDLARNDLARICQPGTRTVADLLKVDRYSQVMHLVSRVVGQLRDDCDALHAYRACMNMGTLTGAPKVSAAQLIRQVEQQGRGSYGGAVGYLAGNGDMDTCIVIRSAFVKNNQAIIQAGAGVVYDSNPQAELEETENKAKAVILAVHQALNLESTA